jgi:predicted Zn-dependent protease
MKPEIKRFLIQLAIAVLTFVIIRATIPKKTVLENPPDFGKNPTLVIIPTEGIPLLFLQDLKTTLQNQHKFRILISSEMGVPATARMENSKQYNSHVLASMGAAVLKALDRGDAYGMVLTNKDVNFPESELRFVFSSHYEGLSVVSLARLDPQNFGETVDLIKLPFVYQKTSDRSLKVINKALGRGYYGYEVSSDRNSVMFGPIISVDDLDSVGMWYE